MNLAPLALLPLLAIGQAAPLRPGVRTVSTLGRLEAGRSYQLQARIEGEIGPEDRVRVAIEGPGGLRASKYLHPADPDLYLSIRADRAGPATLSLESGPNSKPVRVRTSWAQLDLAEVDVPAIEAEPNDSWRQANPLRVGRAVYGTADDVDYLENPDEGRSGLDWFRFEVAGDSPRLVYFHLELPDRDVSANLRVHRLDPASGEPILYKEGSDPTEVVHDRERERYSTHLSRVVAPGTYFVEVNANHPDYVLRTRSYPVPPFAEPDAAEAVRAGLDYLLEAGDAWFAQIPREGNLFVRSGNLHDTSTRCTACHASSFPSEAALVGHANGYPIAAKDSLAYLVDRLANSPTPLYGDDGLSWQRFIAVPLQAQGEQGGVLLDFGRQVLGHDVPEFARFGPFLKTAWRGRRSLPGDEMNGVVPLDSKFGLAWRDWRVLNALTERTRQVPYAQAADAIADLLDDPDSDARVETFQDRIERLRAWTVVDKDHFGPRIKAEAEALLALQDDDGGWDELGRKPAPGAVYTTGQLTYTLLKAGTPRDDPRIKKALAFLLREQRPFGGWFQESTHENFRTPMRETRYAVMALAEAFPRPGGPLRGWGNVDGGPARMPRDGPIVATLDDLDNLWDVPDADRPAFTGAVAKFLDHPEPLVRARAALCLGRVGDGSAVDRLVERLGDGSKIVSRASSVALRKLGNRGIGVEAIRAALDAPDPATRRGAVRIFAYQFSGMDGRLDLADRLIARTADPDPLTRLQALRSLRQWFYRSNDLAFRRRVVETYIARMAEPDVPVVRKALSEGMYILLDENLGGGVSLQKNLGALPERYRARALRGREDVEREALLGPILKAMESGNELQRIALLRSFDGSFFRGRTSARRPFGMIDVGNDREFGFLVEPSGELLDRTFASLLKPDLSPEIRRRATRLSAFFLVPERSETPEIQLALLRGLSDPDPGVAEASRAVVAESLALRGAEDDPGRIALIRRALGGADAPAVVRALGRNPRLLAKAEILGDLRAMLERDDVDALRPVLAHPGFSDLEAVDAARRGWSKASDAADRLAILDALIARPGVVDADRPPDGTVDLLRLALRDPASRVRERALGAVDRLRDGRVSDALLLASLVDDSPAIRRMGLELAAPRDPFWARADARERMLALLVDPDRKVRDLALGASARHRLLEGNPAMARRVKALARDPDLNGRALATLEAQGFDPDAVEAAAGPGRPRLLGFSTFRDEVNPWFDRPGEDGVSCARCHASHNVFRIAAKDDPDALMTNYRSALKVANRVEPESSLLLRKPTSPPGQGAPDPSSPTGLTHAGGTRWDGPDHPAYRAILGWLREVPGEAPEIRASADGHAPGFGPDLAADGDIATRWQTEFIGANPGYPHELTLDLASTRKVDGLLYVPRQDGPAGRVREFEVRDSVDGRIWSEPIARGAWPDDPAFRYVPLPGRSARFVRLRGLSGVDGSTTMAVAEVAVDSSAILREGD